MPAQHDHLTARQAFSLGTLQGPWRWLHVERDDGVMVLEREDWQFDPISAGEVVLGRYRRDVSVIALDGRAFECSQQPLYVQSAVYDVRVTPATEGHIAIEELAYRTAPSPCEPGFRRLTTYEATPRSDRLELDWDDGDQTLYRVDAGDGFALATAAASPAGAWHWSLRSRDASGLAREEDERWELSVAGDRLAGTYVRTVTTWSEDGADIPCARAPRWSYTDRYVVSGRPGGLAETAVDAGEHPCLADHPDRHLDTAELALDGGFLRLTWRGNREQLLHRD